jgi:hypothetical protein
MKLLITVVIVAAVVFAGASARAGDAGIYREHAEVAGA